MKIRIAELRDLPRMLEIYAAARQFMRETGNPNQWKDSYPTEDVVKKGILERKAYVCVAEGPEDGKEDALVVQGEILGTFYFAVEEDPTYHKIYEGSWLNEEPYGVVHRVASSGRGKGFAKACFDWAGERCTNLRIDTHRENRVMQHVLEKNGFERCGIIYLANGEERLAYHRKKLNV